jgi:predicted phosphodiesterase
MGNADWYVLTGDPGAEPETELQREVRRWTLSWLSDADREYVRSFTPTVEEPPVLAFHGSPGSWDDVILPSTAEDEFRRFLDGAQAPVLAGGHTHMQFLRRHGDSLFLNPGSVGLSYDQELPDDAVKFDPWAAWAVVEVADGHLSVEFRRAPFDPLEVAAAIEGSDLPDKRRASGWRS